MPWAARITGPHCRQTVRHGSSRQTDEQGFSGPPGSAYEPLRGITNLQKVAGLEPRLMQRSAESVMDRPMRCQVDRDWQRGYSVIAAGRVPGTVIWPRAERDPDLDPEAGG